MNKKVIMIITFVLVIVSIVLVVVGLSRDFSFKDKDVEIEAPKSFENTEEEEEVDNGPFELLGTWYNVDSFYNFKYSFKEDGTYTVKDMDGYGEDSEGKYTYDEASGKLTLSEKHEYSDRVEYKDKDYVVVEGKSKTFKIQNTVDEEVFLLFFRDKDKRRPYDEACLEPDKDGFCIKYGILVSYVGNAKEITIPEEVEVIGSNAFAGDFGRGINTRKVTIPGTVRKIKGSAFAYTMVNEVIIEEGVEEIGSNLFMDTCVSNVVFPESVKKIGSNTFNPEELCGTLNIYVKKGSYADEFFKKDNIYYDKVNIIYKKYK
ncbi:MAG: leucine-rich repeat protein [Bacilli bacterium]|nr:leucine-rich repeat protein [Bacilli bacterium]